MVTKQQIDILTIGHRVMVKVSGELVEARYAGWCSQYNMPSVNVEGRILPRKIHEIITAGTPVSLANRAEAPAIAEADEVEIDEVPINERFQFLEDLVSMVATSRPTSLIVVGSGGLGKSHTVFATLARHGLEEDHDYTVCKGMSTPKAMYRMLYENRDKIVVFDDCDSVLQSETSVNLLKAGLDTVAERRISWRTERGGDEDSSLPSHFTFVGKIIFISNLPLNRVHQAILSRALFVDVTMTADEKIERMRSIVTHLRTEVPVDVKIEVIDLLEELKNRTKDLNVRTLDKILNIRIARPTNWKRLATYVVTTGV